MTILLNVRQILKGELDAPDNTKTLLSLCQDDLTSEELEQAKTDFPEAFAVLEQPQVEDTVVIVPTVDPDLGKTIDSTATTETVNTEKTDAVVSVEAKEANATPVVAVAKTKKN